MKFKSLGILGIIALGALLRFYKLDWGSGLFTHPDEYHIVGSIFQLSFPSQMNPHFFSYGTVTIYLIYFTQELLKYLSTISNNQLVLPSPFLIGRFYSALFSTFTILIVYKICEILFSKKQLALIAALFTAIVPGLIQQAHFATPESALTFFIFTSLFFTLKFIKKDKIIFLILASLFLGFTMGVKISSIVFLLPLTITIAIKSFSKKISLKSAPIFVGQILGRLFKFLSLALIISVITIAAFAIVAPYVFLDFSAFRGNLEYEGGLAMGKFSAFYTRQFIDTIPVLFQFEKILPYALGPFLLLFSVFGLIIALINSIRKPKLNLIIVIISFLSIFLTNAFLFAKWTRFIAPSFPFFAIFATYLINIIFLKNKMASKVFGIILFTGTFLWTIIFFSIYTHPDIRITASSWIENNIPLNSNILVEGGNTIDIPLNGYFRRTSLDFYNLEDDVVSRQRIAYELTNTDYFIIQSRRVFMNHQKLPKKFPITANFYDKLFAGKIGFEQIAEFHSYPTLQIGKWKLEIYDEKAEETWSVFDHPVIRIFKKTQQFYLKDYGKLLEV